VVPRKRWKQRRPIDKSTLCTVLVLLLIFMSACGGTVLDQDSEEEPEQARIGEIIVFADESLGPVVLDLKSSFESAHPGFVVSVTVDRPEKLASRILREETCDVLLLEAGEGFSKLADKIRPESVCGMMEDPLVLAADPNDADPDIGWEEVISKLNAGEMRLALDNKDAQVMSRIQSILESFQCNISLLANTGALMFCTDGRNCADTILAKEADCGILRQSDAVLTGLRIQDRALEDRCSLLIYSSAIPVSSAHPDSAWTFLDYLKLDAGKGILIKYGFVPLSQ